MDSPHSDEETKKKLYLEDACILLSVVLLFWLGIFRRDETWAQWALGGILVAMLLIFVRRIRRTYRAFKDQEQGSDV